MKNNIDKEILNYIAYKVKVAHLYDCNKNNLALGKISGLGCTDLRYQEVHCNECGMVWWMDRKYIIEALDNRCPCKC